MYVHRNVDFNDTVYISVDGYILYVIVIGNFDLYPAVAKWHNSRSMIFLRLLTVSVLINIVIVIVLVLIHMSNVIFFKINFFFFLFNLTWIQWCQCGDTCSNNARPSSAS
uniref:Uncharacterized protein n=1 Tax=Sipha flava TaxID=143950 RepID=A0A2S2PZ76_9HEMI